MRSRDSPISERLLAWLTPPQPTEGEATPAPWLPGRPRGASEEEVEPLSPPPVLTVPRMLRSARHTPSRHAVLGVLALVLAGVGLLVVRLLLAGSEAPMTLPAPTAPLPGNTRVPAGSTGSAAGPSTTTVVVHVVGRVRHPGVVRLDGGARVLDAVAAAGGLAVGGDASSLNLARVVTDGEQVRVPRVGEVALACAPAATSSTGAVARVSLNSADASALDSLPGVGPVLAQRIVDWRTAHGRFTSVDELGEVSGIGDRLLSGLRDLVTL